MPKIFISYRREDTSGHAGRIFDRLAAQFGRESVFMDVDAIPFGVDFRDHLEDAVGKCDVLLALIGESWLTVSHDGKPRLGDERDFVRIEIEAALKRGIPVIPVLIGRALMPREEQLPATLGPLVFRNAAPVDTGRDFHSHVDRLIRGLEHLHEKSTPAQQASQPQAPMASDTHSSISTGCSVTISRVWAWTGALASFYVSLDGADVGALKNGKDLKIEMTQGTHTIEVYSGWPRISKSVTVKVSLGEHLQFETYVQNGFFVNAMMLEKKTP